MAVYYNNNGTLAKVVPTEADEIGFVNTNSSNNSNVQGALASANLIYSSVPTGSTLNNIPEGSTVFVTSTQKIYKKQGSSLTQYGGSELSITVSNNTLTFG